MIKEKSLRRKSKRVVYMSERKGNSNSRTPYTRHNLHPKNTLGINRLTEHLILKNNNL